jgi:hypothetical protein
MPNRHAEHAGQRAHELLLLDKSQRRAWGPGGDEGPKTLVIRTFGTENHVRCWAYSQYLRDERGSHTAETTGWVEPLVMVRREG